MARTGKALTATEVKALQAEAHDLLFVAHYRGQFNPSQEDKERVGEIVDSLAGAASKGLQAEEMEVALRELVGAGREEVGSERWAAAMQAAEAVLGVTPGRALKAPAEIEADL